MSKWRPSGGGVEALYVISDIHGQLDLLQLICDRILPLRKSDGIKDKLIFTGDYLDRGPNSDKVLDFLIDLEKKYSDQIVFLMGNHELMLLEAFNLRLDKNCNITTQANAYKMWFTNGGRNSVINYLERNNLEENVFNFPKHRVIDLIPKTHIEFLQRCKKYHEESNFLFVHGGIDPKKALADHEIDEIVWDRSLLKFVINAINNKQEITWEKTIVCGHSPQTNQLPIVHEKFLMLDCGIGKLLIVELNSLEAFQAVSENSDRLLRYELKETQAVQLPFGRKV